MSGRAPAGELEPQQPLVLTVGWCEFPLPGGVGCEAREVLARTVIFDDFVNYIARSIDGHPNRDLDAAVDRAAGAARNVRNDFVEHGR